MDDKINKPFFSIIIATYNSEQYIKQAINSILNQDFKNYEIIIIDGLSKDKTTEIIQKYIKNITFFKSEPDTGIYDAWNKAISVAKGSWIYFLGSDDYLKDSDVLINVEKRITDIEFNDNSKTIIYGEVEVQDEDSKFLWVKNKHWDLIKKDFFQINCLHHQGVFHKNILFKKNGNFNSSFKIAGDYEFLLRELKNNDPVFIDTVVCCSRIGGLSNNISQSKAALSECYRARKIHLKKHVGLYWIYAYIKLFIKIILKSILKKKLTEIIISWYRKKIRLDKD